MPFLRMTCGNVALLILLVCLTSGCAHVTRQSVFADQRVNVPQAQCFRCLEEAWNVYLARLEREPANRDVGAAAFRVYSKLQILERLLGLYPGKYQDVPRAVATLASEDDVVVATEVARLVSWSVATETGLVDRPKAGTDVSERLRQLSAATDSWEAWMWLAAVSRAPLIAFEEGERAFGRRAPILERQFWLRWSSDASVSGLAVALLGDGTDAALAQFCADNPKYTEFQLFLGQRRVQSGDVVEGLLSLEQFHHAFPESLDAALARAEGFFALEQYTTAVRLFEAALERVPNSKGVWIRRIAALSRAGRYEYALSELNSSVLSNEAWIDESFWRAYNLYHQGRVSEARVALRDVLSGGEWGDARVLAGLIDAAESRWDDALAHFDASLKMRPDQCDVLFLRAGVLSSADSVKLAAQGFSRASECYRQWLDDLATGPEQPVLPVEGLSPEWEVAKRTTVARQMRASATRARRLYAQLGDCDAVERTAPFAAAARLDVRPSSLPTGACGQ